MQKRTVKIGEYNTADYGWTLTGCTLAAPEQKTNYVDLPGGDGNLDLSTVLSEGIPRYKDRTLTVTLENSQGTREAREVILADMVNQLDGLVWHIVLPDRPDHYLSGRVHVQVDYSDRAHAAVTITAQCEPWFYKARETVVVLNAPITISTEAATFYLWNSGRKVVVPRLTVAGVANLTFGGYQTQIAASGTYDWPALQLAPGQNTLIYTGSTGGVDETLTLTYREAVLR